MTQKEIIIEPTFGRFTLDLPGLFQYRDLLWLLIQREISAKFRQTVLGPLWFLVQPCCTAAVYWFAFHRIATIPIGDVPPVLFFFANVALWNYFSQTCGSVSEALNHHAHLMTKVHFPRLIVPLSIVSWRLFPLSLQLFALAFLYAVLSALGKTPGIAPSILLPLLLPALILLTGLMALGVGLIIAAGTVRFRDLHHLFGLALQLWVFATPVAFPMSVVPKEFHVWMMLNPLCGIFAAYQAVLYGNPIDPVALGVSGTIVLVVFSLGLYAFQRVERTFVDTV